MSGLEHGDPVEVRDARGVWLPAVARSGVRPGRDFPVVWVGLPGVAEPMPWPATDVRTRGGEEGAGDGDR